MNTELYHYNKNHDKLGRFASSTGGRSKYEKVSGGNREELEKAKKKINKKRFYENQRSFIERRLRQENEAYDRYVDTSGITNRKEKVKAEKRLFEESDFLTKNNDHIHRSDVDRAFDRKISSGKTFMKSWKKVITSVPEKTDVAGFNKRMDEYRSHNNYNNSTLNNILNESGYESTKEGRKYVKRLFDSGYEMALEDSVRRNYPVKIKNN